MPVCSVVVDVMFGVCGDETVDGIFGVAVAISSTIYELRFVKTKKLVFSVFFFISNDQNETTGWFQWIIGIFFLSHVPKQKIIFDSRLENHKRVNFVFLFFINEWNRQLRHVTHSLCMPHIAQYNCSCVCSTTLCLIIMHTHTNRIGPVATKLWVIIFYALQDKKHNFRINSSI